MFNTKNVNTIEELIIKKVNNFFKNIYPVDKLEFYFSQGWLKHIKSRHDIKLYNYFRENISVDMKLVKCNLKSIRDMLDQLSMEFFSIWMKHGCSIGYN